MMSRSRTYFFLIALAIVSAGVLGYFMWLFLSPPDSVPPVKEVIPTDVEAQVVNGEDFRVLYPYAQLPIVPTNVGRADPFLPLPKPEEVSSGEEDVNAIPDLLQNVNGG